MKEQHKSEVEKNTENNLKWRKKFISEMDSTLEEIKKQINTMDNKK